jgi:aspartate/methionine/tyrosine aminotransferase
MVGYGTSVGYQPLREWIAQRHGVTVDQVLVTNGSMQADAFLFQLLVNPGDAVVVESPTYDRTLLNLRNRGADIRMMLIKRPDRRVLQVSLGIVFIHAHCNVDSPWGSIELRWNLENLFVSIPIKVRV